MRDPDPTLDDGASEYFGEAFRALESVAELAPDLGVSATLSSLFGWGGSGGVADAAPERPAVSSAEMAAAKRAAEAAAKLVQSAREGRT